LQLQSGRFADDAHISHHTMIHHITRADSGAAIIFSLKSADLGFLDLTDNSGDNQVAF
jgi:hypothetical protein